MVGALLPDDICVDFALMICNAGIVEDIAETFPGRYHILGFSGRRVESNEVVDISKLGSHTPYIDWTADTKMLWRLRDFAVTPARWTLESLLRLWLSDTGWPSYYKPMIVVGGTSTVVSPGTVMGPTVQSFAGTLTDRQIINQLNTVVEHYDPEFKSMIRSIIEDESAGETPCYSPDMAGSVIAVNIAVSEPHDAWMQSPSSRSGLYYNDSSTSACCSTKGHFRRRISVVSHSHVR